jgi:betaine-aldehyde dehydrogenase
VDLVSFTGGTEAGISILSAAATSVKRVALELGGKSPNIVFADADLEAALDNALVGAFLHAGQSCSAGCRVIVEAPVYDEFVAELGRRADRIVVGHGMTEGTEIGALITDEHRAKVERHIARAIEQGARLVAGGGRPTDPALAGGFYLRPTVFADVDREMAIIREEVFGPVVTVERFTTEDEAVFLGNDTRYGLAGAVWTRDAGRAQRVARRLRHGTVWINEYNRYLPQAEWGGFKQSGIGRELGHEGLAEFRETKHIYENTAPAATGWFGSAS